MGGAVEECALERGHTTGAIVDNARDWEEKVETLRGCDMAFEFSTPATAVENILRCFELGLGVVAGTTGWYDRLEEVEDACRRGGHTLFVASNYSIGMNIMMELNRRLAHLMEGRDEYGVAISETHHIHKLDAPSGTALTLARDIESVSSRVVPPITSHRIGEVAGIHEVVYDSEVDTLSLRHEAKSRKGLAVGAVCAAEYVEGKRGFFTMNDLLGF